MTAVAFRARRRLALDCERDSGRGAAFSVQGIQWKSARGQPAAVRHGPSRGWWTPATGVLSMPAKSDSIGRCDSASDSPRQRACFWATRFSCPLRKLVRLLPPTGWLAACAAYLSDEALRPAGVSWRPWEHRLDLLMILMKILPSECPGHFSAVRMVGAGNMELLGLGLALTQRMLTARSARD